MLMPGRREKSERVASYHVGFKRGACGSAYTDAQMSDADFARGYADGRAAKNDAINAFCSEIGHDPTLDVLRDVE